MKFFVSADIEGTTGISNWRETTKGNSEYSILQKQMSREVGTLTHELEKLGANEILVRDAHDSANNLDINMLSVNSLYYKEWTGDYLSMMAGIDASYSGVFFTGYHIGAHSDKNPLAHTMSTDIQSFKINGEDVSEFNLNAYIANHYQVPVLFISGDSEICSEAKKLIPNIKTLATFKGIGSSTVSIHPNKTEELMKELSKRAVGDLKTFGKEYYLFKQPSSFTFQIEYKDFKYAYRASHFPGVEKIDHKSIKFTAPTIIDAMKIYMFLR